jgi:hypothetical protein
VLTGKRSRRRSDASELDVAQLISVIEVLHIAPDSTASDTGFRRDTGRIRDWRHPDAGGCTTRRQTLVSGYLPARRPVRVTRVATMWATSIGAVTLVTR